MDGVILENAWRFARDSDEIVCMTGRDEISMVAYRLTPNLE
ncbi:MAG: hypothetical protein ACR2PI_09900 [Hyphomicrobiaceae bacterium]